MTAVLVIGAGIAGLTAAFRLRQAGFAVTCVDEAQAPGGRLADLRGGDVAYNSGARLLYPFGRALQAIIRDVGLAGAIVPVRGLAASCRVDGAEYRLELMPGLHSLRTPGLTAGDRLRLLAFAARLLWLRRRVDPDDIGTGAAFDGETLAAFANRVLGPRITARLIDPVFRGTRSWDPGAVSPAFLMTTLPHMLGRRTVHVFREGMGQLTRALAERVGVRCGVHVRALGRNADGVRAHLSDGTALAAELAVVAVPGARAPALLDQPEPEEARFFGALRYNSLGVVHYALDGDVAPVTRFIDAAEEMSIATFQLLPVAPGRAQIYCQLTPEASEAARGAIEAGTLDRTVRDDLRTLFPELDRRERGCVEQWIEHKLPVPYPGFVAAMTRFRAWQAAEPRRVYVCGDYLAQPLVNGACASGAAVATLVAQHWGAH